MKLFMRIVNTAVWSLLALFVAAVTALRMPAVQDWTGEKVAQLLSEKLGTTVEVGRIDLGFMNRLILDDVVIYDQQQKKLLNVGRLTAKVDIGPLAMGRIVISSAQIFGAHAHLYKQTAESPANFQFVLDSLASKDTTEHTPLDLRINSFIMRNSSVSYDQWDVVPTHNNLNPKHLNIVAISAHVILKKLTDDSLNVNVKRLAFREQSGLTVSRLAFRLDVGNHGARLDDLALQLPATRLHIDSLVATYESSRIEETLHYIGSITDSRIRLKDVRCLLPPAATDDGRPWGYIPTGERHENIHIDTHFQGTAHSLTVPRLKVNTEGNGLKLQARGDVNDRNGRPAWNAVVDELALSGDYLQELATHLPAPYSDILARLGDIDLNGTFGQTATNDLSAQSTLRTAVGDLNANLQLSGNMKFSGKISTEALNLHQLLDDERMGRLVTDMALSGELPKGAPPVIEAHGVIAAIGYDGHEYNNISIDGSYGNNNVKGMLTIDDERIKASVETDITATSINDAVGVVSLRNLQLPEKDLALSYVKIESGFSEGLHYMTLNSDFAHVQLKGDFDYATLPQSLTNFIGSKLPTLPGLPPTNRDANNNFTLQMNLASTDWIRKLWDLDLTIHDMLTLSATVSDSTRQVGIESTLPSFTYNGGDYGAGHISITSPNDNMIIDATLTKQSTERHPLTLHLHANAANNNLHTTLNWNNNNPMLPMSGQLNAVGHLYRNNDSQPEAHFSILPSALSINGDQWLVEPSDVLYSTGQLMVDHFEVHNGGQHIKVNGLATKQRRDSLVVDLNDVEVAYILDLVDFDAVAFSGQASGCAVVNAAFGDPSAKADLRVNHFRFENGRMGVLTAHAGWNKQEKQIDIDAIANDGPDAMTYIQGYVSPEREFIDLAIRGRGTHIDFMHSFTSSFLSDISGHATGDLRLSGPLSAINLTGGLIVDGQATVTPLNTTYQLRKDTLVLVYNEIQLNRQPIYDKYDNQAWLSGAIHHKDLTNLSLDLNVSTDRLLAYDFHDFGDQSFYGTVYAAGNVDIALKGNDVHIDCNVTPLKNTVFTYNAAQADAVSDQEFITWKKNEALPSTLHQPPSAIDPSPSTNIYMSFLINTTPDATMRLLMDAKTDDYITLNGNGTLQATYYNKGAFQMFGTYTVEHGTYGVTIQNIIKKNFAFQPNGTIVFGGDPYDASLNLQAVYTVQGVSLSDLNIGNSFSSNTIRVNCLMNIGGQPNQPRVDFDLDMPTVNADEQQMIRSVINGQQEMNQQVLYLLAIGRFYNQGQNNQNNAQAGQTTLAMQSLLSGTLSTQINTVLSSVIKNEDWNFGANISTGTEGWNNAEYEGIVNGRMLNNRLLINGQFGYRDNATQANPSFIGDFDIRYLLYPNGNLALKVYNQTNDRYFTRSSLNTQGIGLIMKKDFNGLNDLLSRKKKKKTGKESKKAEDFLRYSE